jgi:hypothetical protein
MSEKLGRRRLMHVVGASAAAAILPIRMAVGMQGAPASSRPAVMPKAMLFDCFGTVVQWRSSIVAEATAWGRAKGLNIDWTKFERGVLVRGVKWAEYGGENSHGRTSIRCTG